ncbi:MAG: sensor histidine kinase [Geminicoccaceae bacterium]
MFDEGYRDFLELLAGQVSTAIANARAHEEERRRAEALAAIDRAKTLFFSNVSHEFRTPLTLMLGPLEETLARHRISDEDRQHLTTAHRNGLRLLRLVNSLLDFSRVEAGRAQAVYEPTDLAALTADLASSFRSACEKANISLKVDCQTLAGPVHVDRDMWEKIVLNLVSNAFKFTFEGEIEVRLRSADGNRAAELTVRDTGVGIPNAELPRVFERFHRVADARARTHEGGGIGLALVQELVRLHGGTVMVASIDGEGTSFLVRVPLGTAHLPAERIGAIRTLASTATHAEAFVEEALRWLPDATDEAALDHALGPDAPDVPASGTNPYVPTARAAGCCLPGATSVMARSRSSASTSPTASAPRRRCARARPCARTSSALRSSWRMPRHSRGSAQN